MSALVFRLQPDSYDAEARTVEAVVATADFVLGRGGVFEKIDPAGMKLHTVSVRRDHKSGVDDIIGIATNFRWEGDKLLATLKFASDPDAERIASRIREGVLKDVSIGFRVFEWRDGTHPSGRRSRIAVRSEVIEISIVSDPADPNTGIRSMPDDHSALDDRVQRNRTWREICRRENLSQEFIDSVCDSDMTDDHFRMLVAEGVRLRAGITSQVQSRSHNDNTLDNPTVFRGAATAALVAFITGEEAKDQAAQLASNGWIGFHREILRRAGQPTTGDDADIIARAMTTSDLPMIAAPALNQTLRRTYEALTSPSGVLFGSRTARDFNVNKEVLVDWTTLAVKTIGEHGEYQYSYVDESGESWKLYTIGGITGVSRQLWVNGAGALANLSQQYGRRLAADVNDRRVAFITQAALAGPTMSDTKAVFHNDRDNIEALNTTSIATVISSALAARAKMPKRKGAGDVMVGALPRYWLVPSEFEAKALQAVATVQAADAANTNVLAGKLEVIVEPRLESTTTSYLVAAPAAMDGAIQASLAGQPGPHTESRWGFEVDAIEFKIRLDLGFGWPEWRSWTRLDHAAS